MRNLGSIELGGHGLRCSGERLGFCAAALAAAFSLGACSSGSGGPSGPQTTFSIVNGSDGKQDINAVPWPSDLLRDVDGHIALTLLPLATTSVTPAVITDLNTQQDGFGVFTGAYFPVGKFAANMYGVVQPDATVGSVDASTVTPANVHLWPLSCPDGSITTTTPELPVYAILRAADTPERIYARPERGVVLREKCTYAYVVTRDVKTDKGPLVPSQDLFAILGDSTPDARLSAAYTLYAPLRARLAAGPVVRDQVAAATVFTTHSLSTDYLAARTELLATAVPAAKVTYVFASTKTSDDDGSLDELFGVPTVEQAGIDNAGGIAHAGIDYVIQGNFQTPDYLGVPSGAAKNALGNDTTVVGVIEHDADGKPTIKDTITVPFSIVIPKGVDLTNVPFAVIQHGLGVERQWMMSEVNILALRGIASILIDLPFHGDRIADVVDMKHNFTHATGPDGFGETSANASFGFFATSGNPATGVPALLPRAIRAAFFQSVNDIEAAFRLMAKGDLSAIGTREPRLATLHIDDTHEVYVGESFGSMIGTIVSAFEPKLVGTVLDVDGGGTIFPLLLNSATFGPIFGPLLNGALGTAAGGTADPADTDWGYNLAEQLLDVGDSLAYAQFVVAKQEWGAASTEQDSACHVLQFSAFDDELVPNPANLAVARGMGLQPVKLADGVAPDLTGWSEGTVSMAPLTANLGGQTAAFVQFHEASHGMMSERTGQHTATLTDGGAPFTTLAAPVPIANPTDRLNMIMGDFIEAAVKGNAPSVQ